MMLWHALIDPFLSFGFMRRALMACSALSLSAAPLGVFLLLRRMSTVGDALSHAVLPGAAIGYLISGMSLVAMGVGGFIAGLAVAMLSGLVSRRTPLKEDASFAGFYLGSLALGSRWSRCAVPAWICCTCCSVRFWRWMRRPW